MKILVPIKRVVDYNVKVRPLSDNTDVDLNNVKMAVNPFCEIALEEAVKLKEAGQASEAAHRVRRGVAARRDRGSERKRLWGRVIVLMKTSQRFSHSPTAAAAVAAVTAAVAAATA